jgi:hypothetical protein
MNCNLRKWTRLSPHLHTSKRNSALRSTTGTWYFDSGFLVPRGFLIFCHHKVPAGERSSSQNALSQQKFKAGDTHIPTLWRRVLQIKEVARTGHEIPPFSCNRKVQNHDNSPPLSLSLGQINSAHTFRLLFFQMCITLPLFFRLLSDPVPFTCSLYNAVCTSHLLHAHIHLILLNLIVLIIFRQYILFSK